MRWCTWRLGWLLGPSAADVLRPDSYLHAELLERLTELGLLISLFAVGLRLGVPLRDRRWRLPLRLAGVSMAATVAMVTVVGLMGLHELGSNANRWWTIDLLWAPIGGVAIGGFLGIGLVGMACGIAQISLASRFLAVFAAGLALQRVRERPRANTRPLSAATGSQGHSCETLATHSHHASATMRDAVQRFNARLKKRAELALVLVVGAMLA